MNSINQTINGLASSLLLNLGCTKLAEKLDPVVTAPLHQADFAASAEFCAVPCEFGRETGQ
jgi:hypothetical protein